MALALIIYAILVLLLLCGYSCVKPKDFPPGPIWYPIVGCLPIFQRLKRKLGYMHRAFEELSERYGPILGIKLGKQKFVIISSYDLVKKALMTDELNGRPNGFFFRVRSFGKDLGVLFTEGTIWSQHRRFTMRYLKSFGLGQEAMERLLNVEAQELVSLLRRRSRRGPVLMHTAFDVASLNALWTMFAGHRFDADDAKLQKILQVVHEVFRLNDTLGGLLSAIPPLRFVAPKLSGYDKLMDNLKQLWGFLDEEIANHEADLPLDQPRDLIDAFLMEIREREDTCDDKDNIFDRDNLLILCLDLFLAGSKTTTDTLAMMFAFLALNPKWIKELQNELDERVGRERPPLLADMAALPKVRAFMSEAQRTLELTPLGVPHKATKDVTFEGHVIPQGATVILNLLSVSMDKKYWDDPEQFNPGRFLNDKGEYQQPNAAIPFGLGKRRCLGEGLARHSLFLFFVYVLHHFALDISEEHGKPSLHGTDGFTISPKPYYLKLTPRLDMFPKPPNVSFI